MKHHVIDADPSTAPPGQPHTLRSECVRGGNKHMFWWVCAACRARLIEISRSTGAVLYYAVPPCTAALSAMAAITPGTITEGTRVPPSKQAAHQDTPPYPFLDRPILARPGDGRPDRPTGARPATEGGSGHSSGTSGASGPTPPPPKEMAAQKPPSSQVKVKPPQTTTTSIETILMDIPKDIATQIRPWLSLPEQSRFRELLSTFEPSLKLDAIMFCLSIQKPMAAVTTASADGPPPPDPFTPPTTAEDSGGVKRDPPQPEPNVEQEEFELVQTAEQSAQQLAQLLSENHELREELTRIRRTGGQ